MRDKIIQTFQSKTFALNKEDSSYEARKEYFENNKRFYFADGVVSLPFGHPNLKQIDEFKKEKGQKLEKYFWEEKEHLSNLELRALKNHPRLYLYNQILISVPKLFNISQKNDFTQQKKNTAEKKHKRSNFRGRMDNEINYTNDAKFWWWEELGVVKLLMFKIWEKIRCLETLKKGYGYQKYHFLPKERIILEIVS